MMKTTSKSLFLLFILFALFSCKKQDVSVNKNLNTTSIQPSEEIYLDDEGFTGQSPESENDEDFLADASLTIESQLNKSPSKINNFEVNPKTEIRSKRDRTSKHYLREDGKTIDAVLSPKSMHYQNASGEWEDINTNLITSVKQDYIFANTTNNLRSWFPADPSEYGVIIQTDNSELVMGKNLTMSLTDSIGNLLKANNFKTVIPKANKNTVTYNNVLDSIDNEYVIKEDEIKHNIILNGNPISNDNTVFVSFSEDIELPKNYSLEYDQNQTGLVIVDTNNEVYLQIPSPQVYEKNNELVLASLDDAVFYIEKNDSAVNTYRIITKISAKWLNERTFPVVVDPTILLNGNMSGYIRYRYDYRDPGCGTPITTYNYDAYNNQPARIRVGYYYYYYRAGSWGSCSRSDTEYDHFQSWIKYDTSSIPDTNNITNVEFSAYVSSEYSYLTANIYASSSVGGNYTSSTDSSQYNSLIGGGFIGQTSYSGLGQKPYLVLNSTATTQLQNLLISDYFQIGFGSNGSSDYNNPYKNFETNSSLLRVTYASPCESPVASCQDFTVILDSNGLGSITVADMDNDSTSECGIQSITLSQTDFTCADLGPNTVTLIVTDVNGTQASCTATVTVVDNMAPEITCTSFSNNLTNFGTCTFAITNTSFDATITDNCSTTIENDFNNTATLNGAVLPLGITTVIWTVTDLSGNTNVCSQVIEVNTPNPVLANITPNNFSIGDTITIDGNYFTNLDNVVTLNGIDATVVSESATSISVIVPTDVCSGNIEVTNACGVTSNVLPYTINAPSIMNVNPNVLSPIGGSSVVISGTDFSASGNSVTIGGQIGVSIQSESTTSISFLSPAGICSGDIIVNNACGESSGPISYSVNGPIISSINASPVIPNNVLTILGTNFNPGQNSVTFNGINASIISETYNEIEVTVPNMNDVCTASIVVSTCNVGSTAFTSPANELELPVISCLANIEVTAAGATGALVTYTEPIGTDNCAVSSTNLITSLGSGDMFPIGDTLVTYQTTDTSGNVTSCSFTVSVVGVAPAIVCPADMSVHVDAGLCSAVVNFSATDEVGIPASTITYSPDSGTVFPIGTTTVTATATNTVGTTSCTFEVTVVDNEAPVVTCHGDITQNADPGSCDAVVTYMVTSSDNCSGETLVQTAGLPSGSVFPLGTTTNTFEVTDASGNKATCSFDVTIEDNETPTAVCQDLTVYLDANGQASITAQDLDNGSIDNCGTVSLSISQSTFDCSDVSSGGGSGALTTESFEDWTDGSYGGIANATLASGMWESNNTLTSDPSRTGAKGVRFNDDSGENEYLIYKGLDGNGKDDGLGNISFWYRHWNGNGSNVEFQVQYNQAGSGWINIGSVINVSSTSWSEFSASPNISGNDILVRIISIDDAERVSFDDFSMSDVSIGSGIPVILTVTDVNGNISSCTATVTVLDNMAPQIACPGDLTQDSDLGSCDTVVNYTVTSSDNCVGETLVQTAGLPSGSTFPIGTTTNIFEVTDASGNTTTCSFDVTIEDNELPTVVCQDLTVYLDANGQASITAQDIDNGSTDNCEIASITIDVNSFDCSDVYTGNSHIPSNDLFISEYIEGGGNNKCIEIYNGTGVTVDLSSYELARYTNGSTSSSEISLSGVLADGDVYVVCNSSASGAFSSQADLTTGSMTHNGDDAIALLKNGTAIDILGRIGQDPGSSWNQGSNSTANQTLVRASNITEGNTDNSFDFPALATEWISFPQDTSSELGNHSVSGGSSSGVPVTLTVTDYNGNMSSCIATVTVLDNMAPQLTCPGDITQDSDLGSCDAVVNYTITSSDNCSGEILVQTAGLASGSVFPLGTTTNTFEVTDASGNTTTCSFDVTIEDNELPIVACQDLTVYLDANGQASITAQDIDNGSTDNCEIASITIDVNSFDCSDVSAGNTPILSNDLFISEYIEGGGNNKCIEIYNGTGTAVDLSAGNYRLLVYANGNSSASSNISLSGTIADGDVFVICNSSATGTFTSQADQTSGSVSFNGDDAVELTKGGSSIDIFGRIGQDPGSYWNQGGNITQNRTLVRNSNIIDGNIANTYNFPSLGTEWLMFPQDSASELGSHTVFGGSSSGVPVTLTVTDVNGNVSTCTANVTVLDTILPEITCPGNITQDSDLGSCDSVVTYSVVSSDNCTGETVLQIGGLPSGSAFPLGTTTNTFEVTDASGNTTTCSFDVIIEDNEAPEIACVINATRDADSGVCDYTIQGTEFDATFTDNCTAGNISNSVNASASLAGEVFAIGATTVTWTVDDGHGQVVTCTTIITIEDNEAPVIACVGNATRDTNLGVCDYTVQGTEFDATFTDNCTAGSISNDINGASSLAGEIFAQGSTTVTWTVIDGHGQVVTCTNIINVEDNEAPIVDCLSLQVQLDAYGNGTVSISDIDGNSTDNCGIASITLSQTEFDCNDIGGDLDELIISEYIDGTGNDDCLEIFNGTGNPVNLYTEGYTLRFYSDGNSSFIEVPLLGTVADRDVYVICNPFGPGAGQADQTGGFAFDGNDAVVLSRSGVAIDIIGQIGVNPGAGWSITPNTTFGSTLVRNDDVLNGNVTNISGIGSEWTQYPQNTTSHLGTHNIEISDLANNVILTVTDTSGNISICEGNVTVIDQIAPIAYCQDVVVQLDVNGVGSTSAQAVDNGSNDACGIASLTLDKTDFTCADVGSNTVILTVTDNNGNTTTCTATVTVEDHVDPVVITQDITVQLNASGQVNITPSQIDNGSSDNCGIGTRVVYPNSFDCSNVGPNTVTLTVTDNNGLVTTGEAIVTVEDNVAPSASCQNISVDLDVNGLAIITGGDVDGGSSDACGIASYEVFPNSFDCSNIGPNTVTLTVTDYNGNVSTCNATVTVSGIIPDVTITQSQLPEFCQGVALVLTANSSEAISYLWNNGETTQSIEVSANGTYGVTITSETNCTAYTEYSLTGFDVGALISSYTIIATDGVHLQNSNTVQSGGVGVTGIGKTIKLHNASNVVDFAQASQIQINGGSVVGTAIYQPANPIIPPFVHNIQSNSESPNVTINNNTSSTLTGSVYGTINIKNGGTVTFTQPNVYINELKTANDATIEFSGCTNVLVNKKVNFGDYTIFNSNGHMVTLYANNGVDVNRGSLITARIHANDNSIAVNGNNGSATHMIGLFIGKSITGNKNVIWNSDTYCQPCPPPNDGADCNDSVEIPLPFVFEGVGEFCWETSGVINFVNSWGLQFLEINGVNYINQYSTTMPERIDGKYYIRYISNVDWGHFEINGFEDNGGTGLSCNNPMEIQVPFTFNGTDEYCWETYDDIDIVNSWSLELLEINGVNYTNQYSTSLPPKINGKYMIRYVSNVSWGHVELRQNSYRQQDISIDVIAWPNPSDTDFNLRLKTENLTDKAEVNVFDMNNRLVHTGEFNPNEVYNFGEEFDGGVYLVKVTQAGKDVYARVVRF